MAPKKCKTEKSQKRKSFMVANTITVRVFYNPVIGRFTTIDPHAISYISTSPYDYVQNNPINSIDPDGRDLIVLSAPDHVGGVGHAAVLIGNEQTGYTYYSKNGTHENIRAMGPSDDRPEARQKHFNSLAEFEASPENKKDGPYSKGYEIKTDEATDKKMEAAAAASVKSDYMVLDKSCIDVASDALKAGGKDLGYSGNSFFGIQHHYLTPIPNVRFNNIMMRNYGGTVLWLTIPAPAKKEKVGTVTVEPLSKPKIIPNDKPTQ